MRVMLQIRCSAKASEEEKIHVTWKLRASFEKELDVCVPRDKLWDLTAERLWTVERWIGEQGTRDRWKPPGRPTLTLLYERYCW